MNFLRYSSYTNLSNKNDPLIIPYDVKNVNILVYWLLSLYHFLRNSSNVCAEMKELPRENRTYTESAWCHSDFRVQTSDFWGWFAWHRTKLKTKKVNFLVFQQFYLNYAVFLSNFIKKTPTFYWISFIITLKENFEEKSCVLPWYLMENGKVFLIIVPSPLDTGTPD